MMQYQCQRAATAAALAVLLLDAGGCAGSTMITNAKMDEQVIVDGSPSEWGTIPAFTEKGNLFSLRVCSNNDNLYLCIASRDRSMMMQCFDAGLTIWFDPEGGTEETLGIRFPLGRENAGMPEENEIPETDRNMFRTESMLMEMEILGSGKEDRLRTTASGREGIKAVIVRSADGLMVYELSVPLKKTAQTPYAIDGAAGRGIGIGMTTGDRVVRRGENDKPKGSPGEFGRGNPPGKRQGPPGGSGDPRRGNGPEGGPPNSSAHREPISKWFTAVSPATE